MRAFVLNCILSLFSNINTETKRNGKKFKSAQCQRNIAKPFLDVIIHTLMSALAMSISSLWHDLLTSKICNDEYIFLAEAFTSLSAALFLFHASSAASFHTRTHFYCCSTILYVASICCINWSISTFALFRAPTSLDLVGFLAAVLKATISMSGIVTSTRCDCCDGMVSC